MTGVHEAHRYWPTVQAKKGARVAKLRKAKGQPNTAEIDRLGDELGKRLTVNQIDKLVAALRSLKKAAKSLFF